MRPLVIELVAEVIEALLLGSERGGRRLGGFCREGLVHAFMPPVLLGLARHDAHWRNAQLDPPHRQSAQAAGRQRGKRRTIIGEQYLRQAALAKEPLECAPAAFIVGRGRAAAQQVTAEGVGHGQGITGRAIAGAEPALEVDAPDIIGRHNRWHPARRRGGPPPPFTALAKSLPLQQITDGALRRPVLCRRPRQQLGAQFLRPPARMLPPHGDDRLGLCLGDCPRHHLRRARALCQPGRALRPKAHQPLVAGLAAHPVFRAQRRHAVFFRHQRVHQPHPQFHGTDSLPRHARTSCRDGLICYPCCRYILLPMLPVRTIRDSSHPGGEGSNGREQRIGEVKIVRPLAQLRLPPTVQGILASRIDRLSAEQKELLQTLAVIGRESPLALIREVAPQQNTQLERMLGDLQAGEFIYEQPAPAGVEYTFKHALTQDVAYDSLLIERRKLLHDRIGDAIESLYASSLDDHLAELAHHYSHTDSVAKAVEYLGRAGQQAMQRSAYADAIGSLNAATDLLQRLPESTECIQRELPL